MDTGLVGRTVLVTGASNGIGKAIARVFAGEGAHVAITYKADERAASELVAEIERGGGEAIAVPMRLEDPETIRAAVQAAGDRLGAVDVVVANAVQWSTAAPADGRFENIDARQWRDMIAANVEGTVATIAAALPSMRERGWGRVVLVSSSVADEGVPGPSPYGPAKSAYAGIARTLAWDAGRDGVLVNVVGTGLTVTDRNRGRLPEAVREQIAARTPSRRLSTPEDVARLVAFLGSEANANITGETVYEGSANGRSAHVVDGAR